MILPGLAVLAMNNYNLKYAQSLGMSEGTFFRWNAVFFGISLLLAYPLGWLGDRIHPLRIAPLVLAVHAAACLLGGICIHNHSSFAAALVVTGVLAGTWQTVTAPLAGKLLPRATFGQYASALGITASVVGMIGIFIAARVLDHTGHCYRLTYLVAPIFDIAGIVAGLIVLRRFLALGGREKYVAPE
jgi:MFS family permease